MSRGAEDVRLTLQTGRRYQNNQELLWDQAPAAARIKFGALIHMHHLPLRSELASLDRLGFTDALVNYAGELG